MSEAMPSPSEALAVPAAPQWDPFQLMDRMDEEALRRELDGVASTDLVYVVKEGGQEVVGLLAHFEHVQGTDGFPYKPAPDVILTALSALAASPADCLMVGDSAAEYTLSIFFMTVSSGSGGFAKRGAVEQGACRRTTARNAAESLASRRERDLSLKRL